MPLYSFVTEQGHILGVMFLLGVCLGVVYDLMDVLRKVRDIAREREMLGDFCYWIVAAFVIWRVLNQETEGILRFCQFFIGASGMILYYAIGSRIVRKIFCLPITFLYKSISQLYRYIGKVCDHILAVVAGWTKKEEKRDDV